MKPVPVFQLAETELRTGTSLVEASAGTGKTFTIAGLFLRLILEKNLSVREILLIRAEAGIERMAAHVDDRRIGKDCVNQPDVAEVIRHLVNETRLAGTYLPRFLEVSPTKGREPLGPRPQHGLRIGVCALILMIEFADDR